MKPAEVVHPKQQFLGVGSLLVCIERIFSAFFFLVFLHQRHFNSLDLCYMWGLLDDAAGSSRGTVLPLSQVGQGHGSVDLPPVRLVFALHPFLVGNANANAAADGERDERKHAQREHNRRQLEVMFSL